MGNQYSHKEGTKALYKVATRAEAIQKYRLTLWADIKAGKITLDELMALDGFRFACYCSPQPCHGDIIVKAIK